MSVPFVAARWFTPGPRHNPIRKIVVHSAEALEKLDTAEAVARYFANHSGVDSRGRPSKPSAHVTADTDSRVRSVHDTDVAHAAPGANHDGLHLELAGTAHQSADEWLDSYSRRMIEGPAADQVAEWVTAHSIPVHFLTADVMRVFPDAWGITTHYEVSQAFRKSTHWDPGPGFPMGLLLDHVRVRIGMSTAGNSPQEDDMTLEFVKRNNGDDRSYLAIGRTYKLRQLTWPELERTAFLAGIPATVVELPPEEVNALRDLVDDPV